MVRGCVSFVRVKEVYGWLPNFLEDHVESEDEKDKKDWHGADHQEEDEGEDQDGFVKEDASERIHIRFKGKVLTPGVVDGKKMTRRNKIGLISMDSIKIIDSSSRINRSVSPTPTFPRRIRCCSD
ncbi:hypothetical protein L6452_35835 [Arctium lappa]|uniref:Uncharacterized protein n=1 Tax=Arctium lappa TaxID=4217 RepID=A0ACB8YBQ5_ARCLA|nr:hypothetical protein L6452_35835 [Arctium lappa]